MTKGKNLVWIMLSIFLCTTGSLAYAQNPSLNYYQSYQASMPVNFVRTWTLSKPISLSQDVINTSSTRDAIMSTEYYDGLGRPLQTVIKKGSLNSASGSTVPVDMVSAFEYDEFGRETNKYLPFAASFISGSGNISDGTFKYNPFSELFYFYTPGHVDNPIVADDQRYYSYSKTNFEPSPLNRPVENYAPGSSWVGSESESSTKRSIKIGYHSNTSTDGVRIWTISNSDTLGNFGSYSSSAVYATGQLYKTITTDEHGKQVIEFKDKDGKVILKKVQLTAGIDNGVGSSHTGWLCTYYVYDNLDNLRAVIQPAGVEKLATISWSLTGTDGTNLYKEQCFRYEYDTRKRMIRKKVPGAAVVYLVYDARDRLVLVQDGNMRTDGKWTYTWYDNLNRPKATGLWNTGTTGTNSLWATHYNAAYTNNTIYPAATTTNLQELSTTFYDNYDWLTSSTYSGHGLSAAFNTSHNTYLADSDNDATWPYVRKVVAVAQVKGMLTGSRTLILGGSPATWLYTSNYYDDQARLIQVQSRNTTGGTDFATTQYSFSGLPLTTVSTQQVSGDAVQTNLVITLLTYDDLGRLKKTEKKVANTLINSNALSALKTINQIAYNALGQVKIKKVGQKRDDNGNFTSTPRETLTYKYNIRGWLLGVNQVYLGEANPLPGSTNWFGFELGYDKSGTDLQYNGNISTMGWRSMGDNVNRAYNYGYDPANRLLKALFKQKNADGSNNNSQVNYNVIMGTNGTDIPSAYDANGNIKRMTQYGLKLGASSSTPIDALTYNYDIAGLSNHLINVIDGNNDTLTTLGDFRTSAVSPNQTKTSTTIDYTYDGNGNLVKDYNKDLGKTGANGIAYNHLNLPQSITIYKSGGATKGTISYTYDAGGNKLQKSVEELSASVNALTTNITTTTTYIGGAVYETKSYSNADASLTALEYTNRLQFIGQEEGRIRFKPAAGALSPSFEYDYFLKDHLGNVRMVLTEEQETLYYPASTLEGTYSANGTAQANSLINHEKKYYNIDNTKVIAETSIPSWGTESTANTKLYYSHNDIPPTLPNPNYPAGALPQQTTGSARLYKLNATTNRTGLEFIIKVMAGDKIDILGKSYFLNTGTVNNSNSTLLDLATLMTNLLTAPSNAVGAKGATAGQLSALNTGVVPNTFFRGNNGETTTIPKAYINYILLDEQFKYAGGNFSRVGTSGTVKNHWNADAVLQNIPVTKNGYIFVYVSNESKLDVFFDNLQVIHKPGPILEETHYYPFGLTMAGISSRAAGSLVNRRKFNGGSELQSEELSDGSGLEWYDVDARFFDPQIGRFMQVDPRPDDGDQESWVPYQYALDNPIANNDPDGELWNWVVGAVIGAAVDYGTQVVSNFAEGKSLGQSFSQVDGKSILKSAAIGAVTSGASVFVAKSGAKIVATVAAKVTNAASKSKNAAQIIKAEQRAEKLSKVDRAGKDFTKAGKEAVKDVNKAKNGGQMRCEGCGQQANNAAKSTKGTKPPGNEAHVDHVDPKVKGGSGTPNNGQVLCRDCNLTKGAN